MITLAASPHAFVVMAHGDSPFLDGCLRSLRAQTAASAIVVTTSTPSVFIDRAAAAHDAPVLVNPRSEGIAADWNFAMSATQARRVTLAHQDDIYFPDFAARGLGLLDDHQDAVACFTGYDEVDDDGQVTASKLSFVKHLLELLTLGGHTVARGARLRAYLSLGNPLPCSSVTFDRDRIGDFRFADNLRSNLDWDAWLRLAEQGQALARAPERLVGRRHNALTATSRLIRDGVRQREDLLMFRRLWPSPLAEAIAFVYRASY